ncbi:MAG: leucine--tRNA ligase [Candidatus Moranbacteria bacterium]|nr:leucine--tRNA ligase [Candidatus Moranbacteria bacterium]
MKKYNPAKIEPKWQKFWEKNPKLYAAEDGSRKRKFYCLSMFPYPSGEGLHVGHAESYTATDIYARMKRMQGFNVLYPIGWDAFGLPAENYAIKIKTHPAESTEKSIKNYTRQLNALGLSYDWSREIDSSSPEYYRFTQWFFLLLYKQGLAYRQKARANWCPSCRTTLANEQVVAGRCERCESLVIQKKLDQWFFKITKYADQLLADLVKVDWPESIKEIQRNWIGRSRGMELIFELKKVTSKEEKFFSDSEKNNLEIAAKLQNIPTAARVKVFTTRPDTIFGATFMVLAPDGESLKQLYKLAANKNKIKAYRLGALRKNEMQRTQLNREKTGIPLRGLIAVNPVSGRPIPVWVGDYVMGDYGSGAIMAVPAHDERDFEFAMRHNLPVERVIYQEKKYWAFLNLSFLRNSRKVLETLKDRYPLQALNIIGKGYRVSPVKTQKSKLPYGIAVEMNGANEVGEYIKIIQPELKANFWSEIAGGKYLQFVFAKEVVRDNSEEEKKKLQHCLKNAVKLLSGRNSFDPRLNLVKKVIGEKDFYADYIFWTIPVTALRAAVCYAEKSGRVFNSPLINGVSVEKGWERICKWARERNIGRGIVNYRLRDWLVSRQRYWGAPIPIIYCAKCGTVPVPEKDLPVELPREVDFVPTGESPLKNLKSFYQTKCPKCGGEARREVDTMDTFVCSSWYYYRYLDPKNDKEFAGQDKIRRFMPVDLYVGGVEHAVLHLLYSRFFTKFLRDTGYVDFPEPFLKLRNQGIVLGPDHNKMSKSKGNVINPDQIIAELGADTLRLYEMFMGPLEEMKPWDPKGIMGVRRFLEKVWEMQGKVQSVKHAPYFDTRYKVQSQESGDTVNNNLKIKKILHQTIKKVTDDIEALAFNTAISQMMILVNEWRAEKEIDRSEFELFLRILAPFAPHLAEEIWEELGNKNSIFAAEWPRPQEKFLVTDEVTLVVQINGKKRDAIKISPNITEAEAKKIVLALPRIKDYLGGKILRRWVYIPGKIVNIVT